MCLEVRMEMNKFTSRFIIAPILIALLLMLAPAQLTYASDTKPAISFSFDEDNNNISAVQNIGGTLTQLQENNQYTYEDGLMGKCLYLDGSYGLKLDLGRFNSKDYTITFWVKPSEITAHTPILSIVKGDFEEKNYTTILLDENWLQPNITTIYTDATGSSSYSTGISGALNDDMWTHIAIVVDASASDEEYFDKMSLYIDGEYTCDGLMLKNLCNSNSNFWVGINPYSEAFNGYIDELLIFDNALNAEEIMSIYDTDEPSTDVPVIDNNHNFRPDGNNRPGNQHGNQSGNIFDDIIELDQGSLPDTDNSPLSSHLDPGLAAGMEYKTDVYAETAAIFAMILTVISLCCFLTYKKKKHNQY